MKEDDDIAFVKKRTIADRIHSMTEEELAALPR